MKRIAAVLVPLFMVALAFPAAAQEKEKPVLLDKGRDETVKVTVTGDIVLDYVWRSQELTYFTTSYDPGPGSDGENTFEGTLAVRFNVELSRNISAVVEIGKERVDDGQILYLGTEANGLVQVRELHVNIAEFIVPELKIQVGIPTWSFDVRGRGSSFAFDPRHSQSFVRNRFAYEDVTGTMATRAGAPDELDPVGAVLTYTMAPLTVDVVILPAVIEWGSPGDDEALYAVDLWFDIDQIGKGSRVGGILALSAAPTGGTSIFTLGGGAVIKEIIPGLEVYGEAYFQFGKAGDNELPAPLNEDIKAAGVAFQAGARFDFGGDLNPWLGANITMISGDGDDDADDDTVDSFLSYENVNDLLILEDMYFGLDWDTNYFALKFSGGLAMSVAGGNKNLELSAALGICRTMEDVQFAANTENALGTEIDAKLRFALTKQVVLNAAVAVLVGSDVMEQSMGGGAYDDSDDSAMLYTAGAELRF